jgi:diguanylate cyclase (GGDEF)-like protein
MTNPTVEPTYRVLVIDDEIDHCEMIEDCLSRTGRDTIAVTFAHTVQDACRLLEQEKFSFILLDHNLPDGHGSDVLEKMEHRLLTTPVIGLSTSADPRVAIADFRGGAIEFITKHEAFKGDALRRRILTAMARHKRRFTALAIENRRRSSGVSKSDEELVAAARTDPMLGILNRAAFDDIHADSHRQSLANQTEYALCIADVDHFKRYNDGYGHAAGDVALRKVAQALRRAMRPSDILARYGGEEIVALLTDMGDDSVEDSVRRMTEMVASLNLPHENNDGHGRVTVCVGAAVFCPASGETAAEVFERADRALYQAKAAGRNQAVVAPAKAA